MEEFNSYLKIEEENFKFFIYCAAKAFDNFFTFIPSRVSTQSCFNVHLTSIRRQIDV